MNPYYSNDANDPSNPWLSIWIRPKETIRDLVRTPSKMPIVLAILFGIIMILDYMSNRSWGDSSPLFFIFFITFIFGPMIGIIGWFVASTICFGLGRLFGGTATFHETRLAVAWAAIPYVVKGLIWFPQLLIYGRDMFTSTTPVMDNSFILTLFYFLLALLEFVFVFWHLVVLSKALGEVHQFSSWKGFASVVTVPVSFFLVLFIIAGILYA
ncbi:Yip1 family protein [Salinithrix halophila]|uniref:Yip1 family protein n=1 Tax=Salinithrix halophila TaxID=1485204 RepID=A0ABV8JM07_9BACL